MFIKTLRVFLLWLFRTDFLKCAFINETDRVKKNIFPFASLLLNVLNIITLAYKKIFFDAVKFSVDNISESVLMTYSLFILAKR